MTCNAELDKQNQHVQAKSTNVSSPVKTGRWGSFVALAGIALIVACVFWKTLLLSVPISKLGLLGQADSLYDPTYKAGYVFCAFDPSIFQLAFPVQALAQTIWGSGVIPLWNPYNGCGYPLIGDVQSFVFSPLHWLFPLHNEWLHNFGLICEVIAGAAGLYGTCRWLGANRIPACFAGLAYGLCPYVLHYIQLPNHSALLPLLFLPFVRLAHRPGLFSIVLVGATCGLFATFMHPECLIYGIAFASLLFTAIEFTRGTGAAGQRLRKPVLSLLAAGAIAFCLAAPISFPFAEYLMNSDCYKSAIYNPSSKPLSLGALAYNLVNPGFGGSATAPTKDIDPSFGAGSPFLGIVAFLMIGLAAIAGARKNAALLVTTGGALALTAGIGLPAAWCSYVMPIYCLPVLLLCLALLSGMGLQQLLYDPPAKAATVWKVLGGAVILGLSIPLALFLEQVPLGDLRLDGSMRPMAVDIESCLRDGILMACVLVLVHGLRRGASPSRAGILLIVLNALSLTASGVTALPDQDKFSLKTPQSVQVLKELGGRSLACGLHLFLPNTNCFFNQSDLRLYNPFTPERYQSFVQAAGAKREALYLWAFDNRLSPLLDMASVKHVLSQEPVIALDDKQPSMDQIVTLQQQPLIAKPGIRLESAAFGYDVGAGAVRGNLVWKVHARSSRAFCSELLLLDDSGAVLWSSTQNRLWGKQHQQYMVSQPVAIPIPEAIRPGARISVGLKIWLYGENQSVTPSFSPLPVRDGVITLWQTTKQETDTVEAKRRHFQPVRRFGKGLWLFENTRALPEAYIVHEAVAATSGPDALDKINNGGFNPRTTVVVEGTEGGERKAAPKPGFEKIAMRRPDCNRVLIDADLTQNGWVVLTDTWYQGWCASLNGSPVPILRANYLFRAVRVPAGQHHIEFTYNPISFIAGVGLAAMCLLTIGLAALWFGRRGRGAL